MCNINQNGLNPGPRPTQKPYIPKPQQSMDASEAAMKLAEGALNEAGAMIGKMTLKLHEAGEALAAKNEQITKLRHAGNCALWLLSQDELKPIINSNWGDPIEVKRILKEAGCEPSCDPDISAVKEKS